MKDFSSDFANLIKNFKIIKIRKNKVILKHLDKR